MGTVFLSLAGVIMAVFAAMLFQRLSVRSRNITIGSDIASCFKLDFIKGTLINPKFFYKAIGSISGYKVEVFAKKVGVDSDPSTFVMLYFNKLDQKAVDNILLDIQDGSALAPYCEIYIITGGLRLKIFASDMEPQFYIDAINLLISSCKKHNTH